MPLSSQSPDPSAKPGQQFDSSGEWRFSILGWAISRGHEETWKEGVLKWAPSNHCLWHRPRNDRHKVWSMCIQHTCRRLWAIIVIAGWFKMIFNDMSFNHSILLIAQLFKQDSTLDSAIKTIIKQVQYVAMLSRDASLRRSRGVSLSAREFGSVVG